MVIIEKEWITKEGYKAVVITIDNDPEGKLKDLPIELETKHRCGYVGINSNHKAYGIFYYNYNTKNNIKEKINNIKVHGGLTFAGRRSYHKNLWFFGFDANHCDDTYINCPLEYMVDECNKLSEQLKEIEND